MDHDPPIGQGWCRTCGTARTVDEIRTDSDGRPICRTCGEVVFFAGSEEAAPSAPWHFKVLLLGTIGYLIYRLIWFIEWLARR